MRKFSRHRPPTAYLSLPEAVQASFGLTQAQLAQLLGISRATLSLEGRPTTTAVRGLPAAAVGRLAALQQLLPAPYGPAPVPSAPAAAELPGPLPAYEQETLRLRLQKIELEKYPLQQALDRCQTRLAQARLWQQALPTLQATLAPGDERTQQSLNRFSQNADLTLRHDGSAQQLLELRLRLLDYERTEIERLLARA